MRLRERPSSVTRSELDVDSVCSGEVSAAEAEAEAEAGGDADADEDEGA